MKELITYITCTLVDRPSQVEVSLTEGKQATVFVLKVAPEDIGNVIGRQGRTAHALRMILRTVSGREKKKTFLEILE